MALPYQGFRLDVPNEYVSSDPCDGLFTLFDENAGVRLIQFHPEVKTFKKFKVN